MYIIRNGQNVRWTITEGACGSRPGNPVTFLLAKSDSDYIFCLRTQLHVSETSDLSIRVSSSGV